MSLTASCTHSDRATSPVCLAGFSALEYWRCAERPRAQHRMPDYPDELLFGTPDARQLRLLDDRWKQVLRCPVEVLVLDRSHRGSSPLLHYRYCGLGLPGGAVVRGIGETLVCSPELCFLQLASQLTLEELVHLGFELCGTYAPPRSGTTRLVERSAPLSSLESIAALLDHMPRARGIARARRALAHVMESSASPMESIQALLFCMPRRLGGIGIPHARLNCAVEFDEEARKISGGRARAVCDMLWPGLAVEYEGRAFHEGEMNLRRDRARSNALAHMGIRTISVYDEHIRSIAKTWEIGAEIARAVGFRLRPRCYDETQPCLQLRRSILRSPSGTAEPLWPGHRGERPLLAEVLGEC